MVARGFSGHARDQGQELGALAVRQTCMVQGKFSGSESSTWMSQMFTQLQKGMHQRYKQRSYKGCQAVQGPIPPDPSPSLFHTRPLAFVSRALGLSRG